MITLRNYLDSIFSGGGGASGGGGPDPSRMTPASGAQLVAKRKKVSGQGREEASLAQNPGTFSVRSGKGLRLKHLDVDEDLQACDADEKSGRFKYKKEMQGVHPPGCENTVKGLKKKYGDSDQTYKIAWWMKNKGRCG